MTYTSTFPRTIFEESEKVHDEFMLSAIGEAEAAPEKTRHERSTQNFLINEKKIY